MRLLLHRLLAVGGLLLFALLCAAAPPGSKYFRGNAAALIVTTTADSGPGSLRDTIAAASDGDTIQFDAALNGQTISLTSAELVIDKSITISGPGANLLAVSRSGTSQFRIFHALSGHTFVVGGLTITGGDVHNSQFGCGGGILNDGATSTINNCIVSGNHGFDGGGICSGDGSLTIANSSVDSNQAGSGSSGGSGGGIYHRGGSFELSKSTVANNMGINLGGGVMSTGGTMTIIDSTIRSNTTLAGGGIEIGGFFGEGGTGVVRNCTISGNTAQVGGGIGTSSDAALTISNSTVSDNLANIRGSGISNDGTVEIGNTILNSGANVYNNGGTVTSHGYNLSSDNGGGFLTGPGDQINTDPMLGPLQNNGGATFTHELLAGSPAINAGDPNFTPPPDFDQRGPGFPRVFNGRIDIGSLEVQPTPGSLAVSLPIETFDTSAPIDTVIIKPVITTNIDASLNYVGFQGDFTYDERVVTFSEPWVEKAGLTVVGNWSLLGNPLPGPGPIRTFRVSAISLDFTRLSGSGTLYNLRMLRVSSTPGNTSPLVWKPDPDNFIFIDIDLNSRAPDQNNGLITITGTGTPTPSPTPIATPTPAPCTNWLGNGGITINSAGTEEIISVCSHAGEYATTGGAVAGQTLRFSSSVSTDWITIHSGPFSDGPVVAFGPTPLTFANTFTGTLFPHWNTPSCGAQATCRITRVQCTNCPIASPTPSGTSTPTPTPTATATATVPTSTPTPTPFFVRVFWEGFDAVTAPALPAGWMASFSSGPANCTPTGTCALGSDWTTRAGTSQTAPNAAFHDAPSCVTDSNLDTPSIFIPSSFSPSRVEFWQNYDLEAGHDGGVLEISIDGGPFTDIVAAGGSTNYSGTISTAFLSPIAGRQAWTGSSGGYVTSSATLPSSTMGHNVVLRFRLATDCSVGGTGWYVDSISIAYFNDVHPTPTATATAALSATPTATATATATSSATPTATATATATVPTSTPTPTPFFVRVFWEGFDAVTAPALPAGWMTSFSSGPANCTPTGTCALGSDWTTRAGTSQTAPNAAFHDAPGCVTDSNLDTPSIFIPTSFFPSRVEFWQNYDLEAGHDGGVLEISIDGGPFTDIVAAGGSTNYSGTISTAFLSPIAGRQAWTGSSGGYVTSSATLPSSTMGHNVVLRFRLATDCSVGGTGWYVDSISIAYFNDVHPTPTATATATAALSATPTATATATATSSATPTATPVAQAVNLSTRVRVQTGDNVGIGGFIITGTASKQVLLRAIGPSLTQFGIPDALADPVVELHGPAGFVTTTNDNWRDTQEAEIQATGIPPTSDLESAIVVTLAPGAYTAIVRGKNNTSGVGLVEVYDLGPATSQLGNISTRGAVGTGTNVMIGGFILGVGDSTLIAIRGIGPSLAGSGIIGVLADPTLELRDSNGVLLASNDNCGNPSPFPPSNPLEACINISLPPGAYTAILAGRNGGTGIALLEIYNLN